MAVIVGAGRAVIVGVAVAVEVIAGMAAAAADVGVVRAREGSISTVGSAVAVAGVVVVAVEM